MDSPVYLIDASMYVLRAWFALPDSMRDPQGRPTGALFGYARFLADLLRRERPARVAAAFDIRLASSFRNRIYPAYKANREPAPEDLRRQFHWCRRASRALGVAEFASRRYEADDLIATWARRARRAGSSVVIVSRDKDFAQLLGPGDRLWDGLDGPRRGPAQIEAESGVRPEQWVDFQALVGDPVDNVPGVAGIGPKTAAALLQHFGDLDSLLARLDEIPTLPLRGARGIRDKLEAGREAALLARQLVRLVDAPLKAELHDLLWQGGKPRAWRRLCTELGLGRQLRDVIAHV